MDRHWYFSNIWFLPQFLPFLAHVMLFVDKPMCTVIKSCHTFFFTTFEAGYMTQTHIICEDTEEGTVCLFTMEKENDTGEIWDFYIYL